MLFSVSFAACTDTVATIMKDTNSGGAVNAVSQCLHGCNHHHFSIMGVGNIGWGISVLDFLEQHFIG